jgi:DNA-binding NtrC family response regulator
MSERATVLVADDEKFIRDDLGDLLAAAGITVLFAETAKQTLQVVTESRPDLVLLDLRFPDCSDLSLLQRIRQDAPDSDVIMLTGETADLSRVVDAIKLGASDYVPKPFNPDELINRVQKTLELRRLRQSQQRLLSELRAQNGLECLVGSSDGMRAVVETLRKLAEVDGCVLIRGESGTGKELAARALHFCSRRRSSPFISINCAAVPETLLSSELFGHRRGAFTGAVESVRGKFDLADDGTVFLDEIGDMPLSQQTSLLRVLEYRVFTPVGGTKEQECAARFVFATNRDLRKRVAEGLFREDLFYRINVAAITLPALRSRPDDIPVLVEFFNSKLSADMGRKPLRIHADVLTLLRNYDWPGNVRELKHVLEGAMMLLSPEQEELTVQNLPPEVLAASPSNALAVDGAQNSEKEELIRVLRQCRGNQTEAARILGIHRNTIRTRIRFYGLQSGF